ncbi:protocadherin-15-like, partial [Dromaius novaehollandiae]|uniref:protocadherin-15-like n=1 Tax=Dromaius novaehollandiae TaxID=8790 RepID=UPI00311D2CCF
LSSLFLLYHFQQSRGKKSVLEEGDRQRVISSFASRAIEAHKQSNINGSLNNNLPKSSSNITFLSDENPLTTQNPLYVEGVAPSPAAAGVLRKRSDVLDTLSPRRLVLKDASLGGSHRAWTLPAHVNQRHVPGSLSRPVIMDPVQWQQERLQAEKEGTADQPSRGGISSPVFQDIISANLTVKEKARQFEQQALQEMKQVKSPDAKSFRSPTHGSCYQEGENVLEQSPKSVAASPCLRSPLASPAPCPRVVEPEPSAVPSVIITLHDCPDELSPPPTRKPTPPSFRIKKSVCQSFLAPQTKGEVAESIPDPPKIPPPPPPLLPLPPPSPPLLPPPPPPPSSPKVSLSSSSSPSPLSTQHLSPAKHSKSPAKQPAVPPAATVPEPAPRRELKGILKNIQNLAAIEKSVANMYSQIDKNHVLPRPVAKLKPVAPPEPPAADAAAEQGQQNGGLSCVVEELEKRFPSQSTAL